VLFLAVPVLSSQSAHRVLFCEAQEPVGARQVTSRAFIKEAPRIQRTLGGQQAPGAVDFAFVVVVINEQRLIF